MARKRTVSRRESGGRRPVVTGITVHLSFPDGSCRSITYDARDTEALFWTDRAVKEILGRYYDDNHPKMTRGELEQRFNKERVKSLRPGKELQIERQDIIDLWDAPDGSGLTLGLMRKKPDCTPGS